MDKQEAMAEGLRLIERSSICLLGTNGEDGYPNIKAMMNVKHEGMKKIADDFARDNNVDVDTWANNIADAVQKHFTGKRNLILVGHSMGGKAALYAVAANVKDLGNLTAMVVTINSPVKKLDDYHVTGGGSVVNYLHKSRIISDKDRTVDQNGLFQFLPDT
jgi:surfactin synthase thioesterase subunit